jgi:hypothetical protein
VGQAESIFTAASLSNLPIFTLIVIESAARFGEILSRWLNALDSGRELRDIERLVSANRAMLVHAWEESDG